MKRLLPFAGGAALAVTGALITLSAAGTGAACAQDGLSVAPRIDCPGTATVPADPPPGTGPAACTSTTLFRSVRVTPSGRGARVSFARTRPGPVQVDVFQSAVGRTVVGERLVFRTTARRSPVRWSGVRQGNRAAPRPGVFFVRVTARQGRVAEARRVALYRPGARTQTQRAFVRRDGCARLRAFKIERPAFGGRRNRAVLVAFRLAADERPVIELRRGGRTIRTLSRSARRGDVLHRVRVVSDRLPRGLYEVRLRLGTQTTSLYVRRV